MDEVTANEIVDRLFVDMRDRSGLGDELDRVDDDVLQDLHEAWVGIILEAAA